MRRQCLVVMSQSNLETGLEVVDERLSFMNRGWPMCAIERFPQCFPVVSTLTPELLSITIGKLYAASQVCAHLSATHGRAALPRRLGQDEGAVSPYHTHSRLQM